MTAYALGRHLGGLYGGGSGTLVRPPANSPVALSDDERQAIDRLGVHRFWQWVQRGRFDPPQPWERGRA
jgi:hypothetical protein